MTAYEFDSNLIKLKSNLQRFAMSLTADHDNALDLVQDTYLKAITHKEKFTDYSNLKAWVFTIMKNTFINNYRRTVRSGTIIDSTDNLYYLNLSVGSSVQSPESQYNTLEIQKAIQELPDDYRIPFEMHTRGYKYKEIAEHLTQPLGSIKSKIFFARRRLMERLKDFN